MSALQRSCYARWPCSLTKMERLGSALHHDTNLKMGSVRRDRATEASRPTLLKTEAPVIRSSSARTKRVHPAAVKET